MRKKAIGQQPPVTLEARHFEWLFSAAQEHFVEAITKLELENTRHEAWKDEPFYTASIGPSKSRADKVARNKEYIVQYGAIVEFCQMARNRVMEVSAEEFAQSFVSRFGKRKRK